MNLSKKQKEVVKLMKEFNSEIIFCKGYNASCFMSHNLSYRISLPTMWKLEELGYIYVFLDEWNRTTYKLVTDKK